MRVEVYTIIVNEQFDQGLDGKAGKSISHWNLHAYFHYEFYTRTYARVYTGVYVYDINIFLLEAYTADVTLIKRTKLITGVGSAPFVPEYVYVAERTSETVAALRKRGWGGEWNGKITKKVKWFRLSGNTRRISAVHIFE